MTYDFGNKVNAKLTCKGGFFVVKALELKFAALPEHLFYLHCNGYGNGWTVSEAATGCSVANSSTDQKAIRLAYLRVTKRRDRFVAAVEQYRRKGGAA